jgi:hypothetical protein
VSNAVCAAVALVALAVAELAEAVALVADAVAELAEAVALLEALVALVDASLALVVALTESVLTCVAVELASPAHVLIEGTSCWICKKAASAFVLNASWVCVLISGKSLVFAGIVSLIAIAIIPLIQD